MCSLPSRARPSAASGPEADADADGDADAVRWHGTHCACFIGVGRGRGEGGKKKPQSDAATQAALEVMVAPPELGEGEAVRGISLKGRRAGASRPRMMCTQRDRPALSATLYLT